MNVDRSISAIVLILFFLAACSSPSQPAEDVVAPAQGAAVVAPLEGVASYATDGALLLEAPRADRAVQPGADEVFDFKMVNTTGQPLTVVVALEHKGGERWRTSLCVEKQCLLGDGTEPSVTDPVVLPPYLEQAFQAHVFVDAAARSGQQTALTLRVEPLVEAAMPRSVTLSAQVSQP
jgi:hypothetical protein